MTLLGLFSDDVGAMVCEVEATGVEPAEVVEPPTDVQAEADRGRAPTQASSA